MDNEKTCLIEINCHSKNYLRKAAQKSEAMKIRDKYLSLAFILIYVISFTVLPAASEECKIIKQYESFGEPSGIDYRWVEGPITHGNSPNCFYYTWQESRSWITVFTITKTHCLCKITGPYIKTEIGPGQIRYYDWEQVPGTRKKVPCNL
jgi:hypothetical protein